MRRYVPGLDFSLERGTDLVPDDGRYYIVRNGAVIASFRSERAAVGRYKEMIAEAGGYPAQQESGLTPEERRAILIKESINKRLDLAEDYWTAASRKHKGNKYKW
jgi:hypothetical protein